MPPRFRQAGVYLFANSLEAARLRCNRTDLSEKGAIHAQENFEAGYFTRKGAR